VHGRDAPPVCGISQFILSGLPRDPVRKRSPLQVPEDGPRTTKSSTHTHTHTHTHIHTPLPYRGAGMPTKSHMRPWENLQYMPSQVFPGVPYFVVVRNEFECIRREDCCFKGLCSTSTPLDWEGTATVNFLTTGHAPVITQPVHNTHKHTYTRATTNTTKPETCRQNANTSIGKYECTHACLSNLAPASRVACRLIESRAT
jgi:hypothetical protein